MTPTEDIAPSWRTALLPVGAVAATVLVVGAVLVAVDSRTGSGADVPPGAQDEVALIETHVSGDADSATDADPDFDSRPSPEEAAADTHESTAISPQWLDRIADQTGMPRRALQGYAQAQLHQNTEQPDCQVSWPTLAGIGWVESQHGTYAGGEIGLDGTTTVDIIGVALDGGPGVAAIPDTDDGELDGDTQWDRAVGPMQFIPQTWRQWGVSASGGEPDPHHIDDAARSAAGYLCADGRDLTTTDGWWDAVLSYNDSTAYAQDVLDAATDYAAAVRG